MDELTELVINAKGGSRESFDKLYSLTEQEIWFTCIKLLKNEDNAKDVMQNTYITAFLKLSSLQEPEKFHSWIKKIAVNKCKDFLKSKKYVQLDEKELENYTETDEVMLPEEYISNRENRSIILKLMEDTLSAVQYQTVIMYYFDEMSVPEIAEIMECPEGTVMSRLNLARTKMKKAIMEYEEKNDDRLHAVVPIPLFISIFKAEADSLSVPKIDIEFPHTKNTANTVQNLSNTVKLGGKVMSKSILAKVIAIVLGLAVVIGGITIIAANSNKQPENKPTSANSKKPINSSGSDISDSSEASEVSELGVSDIEYKIEEGQVLFENDLCKCYISDFFSNAEYFKIDFECENKTSDKTLNFCGDYAYINGYDINGLDFTGYETKPKETDDTFFVIYYHNLEELGIKSIDEISFRLCVYEYSKYLKFDDYICKQYITLYPTGLNKDTFKMPERYTTKDEKVMLDNESAEIVFLESAKYDRGNGPYYLISFYIENKLDYAAEYYIMSLLLNGNSSISGHDSLHLDAGKRGYYQKLITEEDYLELCKDGILNEITMELRIAEDHANVWSALGDQSKKVFDDTISVKLK